MLAAARTVAAFVKGVPIERYAQDLKHRMAEEWGIEVAGEAARRVSPEFRAAHPEIPWSRIVAQRNVLAHDYGEIDRARLWRLAIENVPLLMEQLEPLVPPPPASPGA
jgi:uncharacterized protein with HEPN domain